MQFILYSSAECFVDMHNILKFIWKGKGPRVSKKSFKKNEVRGITS